MKKGRFMLLCVILLSAILMLAACGGETTGSGEDSTGNGDGDATQKEKLKVAFVYNGSVGDDGWNDAQEKARKATQEQLNDIIETSYIEPVSPGASAQQVFSELGEGGYDIIVAATAAYESDVQKIAPSYPDSYYLICSGASSAANVESFWPDRTGLWYAYGVMAGLMTKTNKVGFVGSNPIPLVTICQNAFLLGAQSVNPDVTQTVIYIGTFYDPAAETDASYSLAEAGCDVLWNNTDTPSHVQVAQEKGLFAMSQYADQREFGPDSYLGGEILNWEPYYVETFQKVYDGTFEPTVYFPSLNTKACLPQEFTKNVPQDVREKFEEVYNNLMEADDTYKTVYSGPIYDTNDELKCPEGEYLKKDDVNQKIDWFVKGTISSVKK